MTPPVKAIEHKFGPLTQMLGLLHNDNIAARLADDTISQVSLQMARKSGVT